MARKINRRFWFQLHGWFSLPVWVVFSFVCLTGTISVMSHEITWLLNSDARADNPDKVDEISIDKIVASVEALYPTADVSWVMAREPYLTYVVSFTDKGMPAGQAYVNQYTGQVQEVFQGMTFIGFMRSLHGWLLFPWHHNFSVGYYLVSLMAIVMLGALITGLVVYKKFWRAFFKPQLRFNKGKRIMLQDIHRSSGVWSLWFLLLMSVTGLWYLAQAVLWHNDVEIEPHAPLLTDNEIPVSQEQTLISIDDALLAIKQEHADFTPTFIMVPEHNRGVYQIAGSENRVFFDQYSSRFSVNPWNAEIKASLIPADMNTLQVLTHIADPLHYGTIGGIWTKIIWFIFGLLLSAMSVIGFLIWRFRLVKVGNVKDENKSTKIQEAL